MDEDIEDIEPEQHDKNNRNLSPLSRLNMKFSFQNNFQYYWSWKSMNKTSESMRTHVDEFD